MKHALNFPALLQAFFTDRLITQRNASPNTIAAYRDSFRLRSQGYPLNETPPEERKNGRRLTG